MRNLALGLAAMIGLAAAAPFVIAGNHGNRPDRGNGPPENKPPEKVLLCHVEDEVELECGEEYTTHHGEDFTGPGTVQVRHVIEVAMPAKSAHIGHGDEEAADGMEPGDPCSTIDRPEGSTDSDHDGDGVPASEDQDDCDPDVGAEESSDGGDSGGTT